MQPVHPKAHASTKTVTHATNAHATPTKKAKTKAKKKEKKTMTAHTHEPVTTTTETATSVAIEPSPASPTTTPQPAPTAAVGATATTTPATPAAAVFLTAPPLNAHSPSPPPGFERPTGANYRGVSPRGTELAAAPAALQDLARFAATYLSTLGATAPPLDHLIAGLTVASGWTSLRVESGAWDEYCATQEGMAWQALRPLLDKLVTAFMLAAASNAALLSAYPGLATLLGAKGQIAQKAASTKRLNKKAVADGKQPYHGAVGKKRQRSAQKAAVATAPAAAAASAAVTGSAPAQPATVVTAPVPTAGH